MDIIQLILRHGIHYTLHFLFPGILALFFFRKKWKKAWIIMVLTMIVDIDHLFATPIFDPSRCSIGFHLLHSYYAIVLYGILTIFPKSRIVAIGLLFHMLTDFLDCLWI
jgi:hypothetical protein